MCGSFETGGLYCEHHKKVPDCVHEHLDLLFDEISHKNFAVCYISAYMHLAFKSLTTKYVNTLFNHITKNDAPGPRLLVAILDSILIKNTSEELSACICLQNSKKDLIDIDNDFYEGVA